MAYKSEYGEKQKSISISVAINNACVVYQGKGSKANVQDIINLANTFLYWSDSKMAEAKEEEVKIRLMKESEAVADNPLMKHITNDTRKETKE
jgi:hypothetical protein